MKFLVALVLSVALISSASAKVFTKCEFARKMFDSGFSKESLPDWVCLAIHESALNANVVGGPNTNGSFDCNSKCLKYFLIRNLKYLKIHFFIELVDDDITDDIACTKIIFARHGFTGKMKTQLATALIFETVACAQHSRGLSLDLSFFLFHFQLGTHGRASVRDLSNHIKSLNVSKFFIYPANQLF